jgi:hypothetical protein
MPDGITGIIEHVAFRQAYKFEIGLEESEVVGVQGSEELAGSMIRLLSRRHDGPLGPQLHYGRAPGSLCNRFTLRATGLYVDSLLAERDSAQEGSRVQAEASKVCTSQRFAARPDAKHGGTAGQN